MFERPGAGERAVLIQIDARSDQNDLSEFKELATSAGAIPVAIVNVPRRTPHPRYFVGTGKLDEIGSTIRLNSADIVLFNHELNPSQERNIEGALAVRVIDRTSLILDIFAQRAKSFEGKLQVELAQLRHLSTRLVRGWTHLERQKGGIGLRGPGETQLETDRRLIGRRIKRIMSRLERVENQRKQSRNSRKKESMPTVALVGYTNAGKSTLFNLLSGANSYAADKLFASLDPSLRKYRLADGLNIILADTVGFVRNLPHELVAAFRSTLQEASEASALLHVIDASADDRNEKIGQVNEVLEAIGAEHIPQIEIYNKIDLLDDFDPKIDFARDNEDKKVWLSSKTGAGVDLLNRILTDRFRADRVRRQLHVCPSQAGIRAKLFAVGSVIRDDTDGLGGWNMEVELHKKNLGLLKNLDVKQGSVLV